MMTDNVLLVLEGDREVWVAVERGGRLFVYDPATRHFHYHRSLSAEWFDPGREMTYVSLSEEDARAKIAAGLGAFDRRQLPELAAAHADFSNAIPVDEVLRPDAPSARQVDLARRRQLETAAPGVWVTVKEYPAGKRSTADVAASDIRLGKLKWARELHPLKTRVVKDVVDGQERFVVQAAKTQAQHG